MLDDLQGQVNEFAVLVGLPVSLTTPDLDSIVFSPHASEIIDDVRAHSLLSRETADWVVRWFHKAGVGRSTRPTFVPGIPEKKAMPRWVVPVHAGGRILAFLCILDPEGRCDEAQLGDLSGKADEIARTMAAAEESARNASRLLRSVLSGDPAERTEAAGRLIPQPLRPGESWRIAVGATLATPPAAGDVSATRGRGPAVMGTVEVGGGAPVECRFDDHHAFLLPARHGTKPLALAGLAPCCPQISLGIGPAVNDPLLLHESYRRALGALRIANATDTGDRLTRWEDLGPKRILALQEPEVLCDAVDARMDRLDRNDSDTVDTVYQYLASGRKPDLVADALHIHRGTLYYRLRKFQDVTGLDLESNRLTVQLSLEALKLLRAAGWKHGA